MNSTEETGCCPRFDPEPWDEKEVTWTDKPFVRDRVRSLFHIPLNFGSVMKRNMTAIEAAGAKDPQTVVLSDENSLWGADVFVSVTGDVPGARQEKLSGTFFTKVFEGPYSKVPRWYAEMTDMLRDRVRDDQPVYFFYTTCPKCAKYYGKNYVVGIAQTA